MAMIDTPLALLDLWRFEPIVDNGTLVAQYGHVILRYAESALGRVLVIWCSGCRGFPWYLCALVLWCSKGGAIAPLDTTG